MRASARRTLFSSAPRITFRRMAAWASPGSPTAISSIAAPTCSALSLGSLSLLGEPIDRAAARAQRSVRERTMNFDDTPEEAAFRGERARWLDGQRADDLMSRARRRPGGERSQRRGCLALAKAWQKRRPKPAWACLTWPKEYGGRGASPIEGVIWDQEEGATRALRACSRSVKACAAQR